MDSREVFTPASFPRHTYCKRSSHDLEPVLLDSIKTKGFIVSISGPSKSGKTVLCEKVLGIENILLVACGGISNISEFWSKLRYKLKQPFEKTEIQTKEKTSELGASAEVGIGIPIIASGKGALQGSLSDTVGSKTELKYDGPDGEELLLHIAERNLILVVDDFHYLELTIQKSLAQQFKEASRKGVVIVVVSVSHRSDDAIRANPDLRGRVIHLDIPYWDLDELKAIPSKGFPLLNIELDNKVLDRLVFESVSSPQLMQALCLELCLMNEITSKFQDPNCLEITEAQLESLFQENLGLANCKSALDILLAKHNGSENKMHKLIDGKSVDICHLLLKAISVGEPLLQLSFTDIKEKIKSLVLEMPPNEEISTGLSQLTNKVINQMPDDQVLEWDAQKFVLNISDPYFLYYIRWANW